MAFYTSFTVLFALYFLNFTTSYDCKNLCMENPIQLGRFDHLFNVSVVTNPQLTVSQRLRPQNLARWIFFVFSEMIQSFVYQVRVGRTLVKADLHRILITSGGEALTITKKGQLVNWFNPYLCMFRWCQLVNLIHSSTVYKLVDYTIKFD
jgi:hypothetical protein